MSRDYRKLRTFHLADELALEVYKATKSFPRDEIFGLTSQMRRAAISISANIVEGSFRTGEAEYLNFLNIALGSAAELGYYLTFSEKLEYLSPLAAKTLIEKHQICIKSLQSLIMALRRNRS
ncbi:MAG: four helix bundle protein [Phycisphaerae bacterium]|nr:four helix bundle protein [Phycisphaerae bacterium]